MKLHTAFIIALLLCSCTSIATVNWVERVGGDDRKKVWIPTCSKCGHVVNFRATQCANPEDQSLMVWRDKKLYFDFPDDPQSDYKNEQLEIIDPREQSDEVIVKDVEEDVLPDSEILEEELTGEEIQDLENEEDPNPEEDIDLEDDDLLEDLDDMETFEDLEWNEDELFEEKDTNSSEEEMTEDKKDKEEKKEKDNTDNSIDDDFEDLDWDS